MNAKEFIFDCIYNDLEKRLDLVGEITTNDAWQICRSKHGSYTSIAMVFKQIMMTMVEQKKAIRIRKGKYNILKPNTPETERIKKNKKIKHV